jgi:hypothetical protein
MSDYVIAAAVVDIFVGISVETGIAMVARMAVDTLSPTVGADACVDCACENCDNAEVLLLAGRAISFKALSLLKYMHKQIFFQKKFTKGSYKLPKIFSQEHLKKFDSYGSFFHKIAQTRSHLACQFIYPCFW